MVKLTKLVMIGAIVGFAVFYAMTSPDGAATIVHSGWKLVVNVAHGLGNFLNKLAS